MGIGAAVTSVLSNYVGFQGRARRSEFWWWALAQFIFFIIAAIADGFVDPAPAGQMYHIGMIYGLVVLGLLLPSLAVTVRRLHDTNRSGFWLFIAIIPLVGAILLLVWYCTKGTAGPNTYGPDPTAA